MRSMNVGQVERAVSVAAGSALAATGLKKRGVAGMALAPLGRSPSGRQARRVGLRDRERHPPGQLIAWKTVGDPDIAHAGSVHFTPRTAEIAEVRIVFDYEPPFARTISSIASHLGLTPDSLIDGDLQRFREYAEATPRSAAKSSNL